MKKPIVLSWRKYLVVHMSWFFTVHALHEWRHVSTETCLNDMYMKCNRWIWWRQATPPAWSFLCYCFNLSYQVPTGTGNESSWNVHINNSLMCLVLYHEITARDVALLNRNASKAACELGTLELTFYDFHQSRHLNLCVATIKFAWKGVQK